MPLRFRFGGRVGVNVKQSPNQLRRAAARHAALGGDTEIGHVPGGGFDAVPRGVDAIAMNQAQEELGLRRERQVAQWLKIGVVML
jgi:hypothetical protein